MDWRGNAALPMLASNLRWIAEISSEALFIGLRSFFLLAIFFARLLYPLGGGVYVKSGEIFVFSTLAAGNLGCDKALELPIIGLE